jgi:hypothetical protein
MSNLHPEDRPEALRAAEAKRKFFRCPACGEEADSSDLSEVIEHHRHVLYPGLDPFTKKTTST